MAATLETQHPSRHRRSHEHGAVTVLLAACMVVTALLVLRVVRLGTAAGSRARAQTAADAAALAGVVEGRDGAAELAGLNGGVLTGWVDNDDEVQVIVTVDDAQATARARREETPPFG